MYILDSAKNTIHDSDAIQRFRISEKDDAVLVVGFTDHSSPPVTLGKYIDKAEAKDALLDLFAALSGGRDSFEMPDSVLFHGAEAKRDARTKRKGGS